MKTAALLAIATMTLAAVGVGTVTAVMHTDPPELSQQTPSPTPTPDSQTTPDPVSEPDRLPSTPDREAAESLSAAEYTRLRDFPHQTITLSNNIEPNSEFGQFFQQFRQAVRDRDAGFVQPRMPFVEAGEIGFGFGLLSVEEAGFNQSNGWIWAVLEKAIAHGCISESAEAYGIPEVESQVWTCPGTTKAFEQQYPIPPDAEGIDHYVNHVMVIGENVNVRAEPSTTSEVIGILSNEVVETNPDGWEVLHQQRGNARPDPIQGWTPVTLPNGKSGFVYSRYAYFPLEPRLVFGKVEGQWQIIRIPAGD